MKRLTYLISQAIKRTEKIKYRLSREYCYDEMEEKGYASQGRCCGLLGGDSWSDNTQCTCVLTVHTTHRLLEGNMKRLTEYTIPETGFSVISQEKYKRILMEEKPSVEKVYNRLKKIEDILGNEYELDRLRELVEADREGLCVVLPAKTVFELTWDAGPECDMVCPMCIDGEGQCDFCDKGKLFVYEHPCKQEHIERLGKDVFLTRAEAEEALKAREQDELG